MYGPGTTITGLTLPSSEVISFFSLGSLRCLRASRSGPGGPHTRYEIPPTQGASLGSQHNTRNKLKLGFLSPDHQIWCSGNAQEIGCVSVPGKKTHGAIVKRGGKIVLCPASSAGPAWACFQNFDESAPVLPYGKSVEVGGFRCKSTRAGITC